MIINIRFIKSLRILIIMDDIEDRQKWIYEQLGEEALRILKESGIDIDTGVTSILEEQERESDIRQAGASVPTLENTLTSELPYLSLTIRDPFGQEYERRLKLIGLSQEQIEAAYQTEQFISRNGKLQGRDERWAIRYFIRPDSTPETLPDPEHMTLSEIICITDDANSAIVRDHHALSQEAFQAACIASCNRAYSGERYGQSYLARTEKMGWTEAQRNAYSKNEFMMTARIKWNYHDDPAWTKETTKLE